MIDVLKLEECFENVIFIDKNHSYRINGNNARCSVTTLLKKYTPEFKGEGPAKFIAAKRGVSVEDVLAEWDYKKEYSCHKGTEFHKFAENYLARKQTSLDEAGAKQFFTSKNTMNVLTDFKNYKNEMLSMISNFLKFYNWYKETYTIVKSELVIGDTDTKICGTIDNLSLNEKTGELAIFDYKTNQNIKTEGYKKETLLEPFKHLQNCEMVKYSLQLWIYKLILEKNTPYKVGDLFIVWVAKEGNYELIPTLDLSIEANKILEAEYNILC